MNIVAPKDEPNSNSDNASEDDLEHTPPIKTFEDEEKQHHLDGSDDSSE